MSLQTVTQKDALESAQDYIKHAIDAIHYNKPIQVSSNTMDAIKVLYESMELSNKESKD